jgi:hypothetical protein
LIAFLALILAGHISEVRHMYVAVASADAGGEGLTRIKNGLDGHTSMLERKKEVCDGD